MKEVMISTTLAAVTGFFGWVFAKMQTRREKKKADLQLINEAVGPLIISIGQLTEQNNEMVKKLLYEQDKNLQLITEKSKWMAERCELIEKVEKLEKNIAALNKKINELVKTREK